MTDTVYRFLPWARRGLAAAIPGTADGAAVPARARVDVEVVVAGAGSVPTGTTLYGPGDVVGLDPTVIVRTTPRPDSTNVEPNYLAAVDFDQPELPWLFTPTGPPTSGRLRPWLVLVVVRDRPGVSLTVPAGALLPRLSITSGAAGELPDLADSWAWAHAQLLDQDAGTTPAAVGTALADHPDRNVSRLVCPRRLQPGERWIACLVPAFDAGVTRGLGGVPPGADPLKPAWSAPDSVELPVYHHWRFQTGPQGDFESLARRLKPYEASARIGRVSMHVGDASPFVDLPVGDPQRFLDMDGALQAPAVAREAADPPVPEPKLADVPDRIRTGLADVSRLLADAADGKLDGQQVGDSSALGPPVYAGLHHRRTTVAPDDDTWFRELNTDPRSRVAAGLGAEVLRKYQEDVVAACWDQVGDVLAVEAALSRARLSLEVGRRFRSRHLEPLPAGRLVQLAAPLAQRTLLDGRTLPAVGAVTSWPDRTTDAAMRRITARTGRILAGVARRATDTAVRAAARDAGTRLVTTLAAGRADVDASRFPVPALDGLPGPMPQPDDQGRVSLERFGVAVTVDRAGATALGRASRALAGSPTVPADELLRPRSDIRVTGLFGSAQLEAARRAGALQLDAALDRQPTAGGPALGVLVGASTSTVIDAVAETATRRPEAGMVIQAGPTLNVHPLAVRGGGDLVVVNPPGVANVTVAHLGRRLAADGVGDVVAGLPDGTIPRLRDRRGGGVLPPSGDEAATPSGRPVTVTVPPLVTDAAVVTRFVEAMSQVAVHTALADDVVVPRLVPFPLAQAAAGLLAQSDPQVVHPRRLDTMVSLAGSPLTTVLADPTRAPGWQVAALLDRVMAYPQLELPAYTYLAGYDRTRFCPGVDEVPPESVTLLETNPRFIAGFMAGLNQETCQELLWRGYPTDGRGTPWRHFWKRVDGGPDIEELHRWGPHPVAGTTRDDLPAQTTDPAGNLVLLVRGDLLRRYPNTMVVAVRAVSTSGTTKPSTTKPSTTKPSTDATDVRTPVFAGRFDPDVSFFGFPLTGDDLTTGDGWFFGLLEPVTEPRFGFDETVGRETTLPTTWNDVAWPDLGVPPGGPLKVSQLSSTGLAPGPNGADAVAAALFQRPFELLVHARHLVKGI